MASRDAIVAHANDLLEAGKWPEFAPPGLQVTGADEVRKIVCGVSANADLLDRAVAAGANMVIVHHGLFWRNEPLVVDRRLRARLKTLFAADCSLVAYHLALDAHPRLGNNAQLAGRIGASLAGPFGSVGLATSLEPTPVGVLLARVEETTGRRALHLPGGPALIERLAICSGAAGYDLIRAAHEGFDALLTGEPEEPNAATARELGIHLIAAGHHATERLGVQALTAELAATFDLRWEYIEVHNPV
jgi:dinuclear metal center YbgI/SA1388 family protein